MSVRSRGRSSCGWAYLKDWDIEYKAKDMYGRWTCCSGARRVKVLGKEVFWLWGPPSLNY